MTSSQDNHPSTNHLKNETSPYLLQHAHNPVNWFSWCNEAFAEAKKLDKPVLVSIGYAACHWCHVMEKESFENVEVAKYMNENFVCIKVDREERPDIDHIYVDAVQAISGSGGWPLNVFCTPDRKPFYGGTYFPPQNFHNRPSWMNVLSSIHQSWLDKRQLISEQAGKLTDYLSGNNKIISTGNTILSPGQPLFSAQELDETYNAIKPSFDTANGGFGSAPKFPSTYVIKFLLQYHYFTANKDALKQALLSLDKMISGGIYDQAGGGFARYSTDATWLVPHFEKMLYDNALLVSLMADAYKITKDDLYKNTIEQTLDFIQNEMTNPAAGFYSSLDADSEGEEGKFYVWSKGEVDAILGTEAKLFEELFDITEEGNWEGRNILHRTMRPEEFAAIHNLDTAQLHRQIQYALKKLIKERDKRIRPATDDKIILGCNAMMVSAYAAACNALGNSGYRKIAEYQLEFLLDAFRSKEDACLFYHNYKNGQAANYAFLDDYAQLIAALLDVYEINGNDLLLNEANAITRYVIRHFGDKNDDLFFYTCDLQQDVIVRKKDFYDGAQASGNSVMASNLQRLSVIFNNTVYGNLAEKLCVALKKAVKQYPNSFANWASVLTNYTQPLNEIAIIGENAIKILHEVNLLYVPNKVIMVSTNKDDCYVLFKNRFVEGKTLIYLCRNYACKLPVESVKELELQLSGK
jgi:uncharacterized protein